MLTLISPGDIPIPVVDADLVRAEARKLKGYAGDVRDYGSEAVFAWARVPAAYEGPGQEKLYHALDGVGPETTRIGEGIDDVATALVYYADEAEQIVADLKKEQTKGWEFVNGLKAGGDLNRWSEDPTMVDTNNTLLRQIDALLLAFSDLERLTARKIDAASPSGAMCRPGDTPTPPTITGSAPGRWGHTGNPTGISVLFGVADGARTPVQGLVEGFGSLSGFNLQNGQFDWSWANAVLAWGALGQFITYNPQTGQWLDWSNTGLFYRAIGEDLIGLESWQQNPAQGTGHTAANIALLAIPGGLLGKLIGRTRLTHHHNNQNTDTQDSGKNNKPSKDPAPSNENKSAEFGTAKRKDYRKTFLEAHPHLNPDDIEVHHAVEQRVLKDYPGVITPEELHSLENLRGIPRTREGSLMHRSEIRMMWNQFRDLYRRLGRSPTKQELLDFATKIDDKFGHLFDPPVR